MQKSSGKLTVLALALMLREVLLLSQFISANVGNRMNALSSTGMTRFCLLSGLAGRLVWLVSTLVNRLAKKPSIHT